jgi:hypothetical protein
VREIEVKLPVLGPSLDYNDNEEVVHRLGCLCLDKTMLPSTQEMAN